MKRCLTLALSAFTLLAPSGRAQTIAAGIDLWTTPASAGAYIPFSLNPVPAGTFCTGSPALTANFPVKGSSLKTFPPGILGNTDTVIERDAAVVNGAAAKLAVRALSLVGTNPLTINCSSGPTTWTVKAWHDPSDKPTLANSPSSITLHDNSEDDDTFDSYLVVKAKINFTRSGCSVSTPTAPCSVTLDDIVELPATGAFWSTWAVSGGVLCPPGTTAVYVDRDNSNTVTGADNPSLPCPTPGFFVGYSSGTGLPIPIDHNGPHPTYPPTPPNCTNPNPCVCHPESSSCRCTAEKVKAVRELLKPGAGKTFSGLTLDSVHRYTKTSVVKLIDTGGSETDQCTISVSDGTTVVVQIKPGR